MSKLKEKLGFLKSKIIYDFKPFNRRKLNRFYGQFIEPNDLCFDIGAHTGNRSYTWLKLGAKVVGFEPAPLLADHLRKRFKTEKRFSLIQKGVGEKNGNLEFKISHLYPTISTFSKKWQSTMENELQSEIYDETLTVEVTTLEALIKEFGEPQLCKIDVEGAELDVLKGLKTPIKCLSFEYYGDLKDSTRACLNYLNELGDYEFNWSIGETLRLNESQWLTYEQMLEKTNSFTPRRSGDIYARIK